MRGGKAFFDTNILVSAFTRGDRRAPIAEALLRGRAFMALAITKLGMNRRLTIRNPFLR